MKAIKKLTKEFNAETCVKYWSNVFANQIDDEIEKHYFKTQLEQEQEASALLRRSFVWAETPEGFQYWSDIHNKLMNKNL